MTSIREQISAALMARLEAVCGTTFAYYSRYFVSWEEITALLNGNTVSTSGLQATIIPTFPALFLYDGGMGSDEWVQGHRGTPPRRHMLRHIVIYAKQPGSGTPSGPDRTPGGTILHPLIEAVEAAFQPGDDVLANVLTLGNLAYWCWLEGKGNMVPGDIDPSGLCMQTMPVKILIP